MLENLKNYLANRFATLSHDASGRQANIDKLRAMAATQPKGKTFNFAAILRLTDTFSDLTNGDYLSDLRDRMTERATCADPAKRIQVLVSPLVMGAELEPSVMDIERCVKNHPAYVYMHVNDLIDTACDMMNNMNGGFLGLRRMVESIISSASSKFDFFLHKTVCGKAMDGGDNSTSAKAFLRLVVDNGSGPS